MGAARSRFTTAWPRVKLMAEVLAGRVGTAVSATQPPPVGPVTIWLVALSAPRAPGARGAGADG